MIAYEYPEDRPSKGPFHRPLNKDSETRNQDTDPSVTALQLLKRLGRNICVWFKRQTYAKYPQRQAIDPEQQFLINQQIIANTCKAFTPVIDALNATYIGPEGRQFYLVTTLDNTTPSLPVIEAAVGLFAENEEKAFKWFMNEDNDQAYSQEYNVAWGNVKNRAYIVRIPVNESLYNLRYILTIGQAMKETPQKRAALEPLDKKIPFGQEIKTHDIGMVMRGLFEKFDLAQHTYFNSWDGFADQIQYHALAQERLATACAMPLPCGRYEQYNK